MADEPEAHVRRSLALALDVDDVDGALDAARRLGPWFGVAKVGLELFSAAGPKVVSSLVDAGMEVFVDLKLHDIPTTVRRAARVIGAMGARYATVHVQGGAAMLAAAVEGMNEGAEDAGVAVPCVLGVTVLSSDRDASPELLAHRVSLASSAGCGGVVCAVSDLAVVTTSAPTMRRVVPGIRLAGGDLHDQARTGTPAEAIQLGADLLVVGRAVTAAPRPEEVAAAVSAEVGSALGRRAASRT